MFHWTLTTLLEWVLQRFYERKNRELNKKSIEGDEKKQKEGNFVVFFRKTFRVAEEEH